MATTVRITETYDLKTTVGKLGIIGIHTPSPTMITEMYSGLCKNHKFIRLKKCDVVGVCASVLPADPLQVGVAEGDVAPEDMFNPILYKAVSNDSFETLVSRILLQSDVSAFGSLNTGGLSSNVSAEDNFDVYYSMLADPKGWKKVMPQNGFAIRGLVPLCHQVINTYGNGLQPGTKISPGEVPDAGDVTGQTPVDDLDSVYRARYDLAVTEKADGVGITFKGKAVRMPKLPLHYGMEPLFQTVSESGPYFTIPKTFCACIIVPPARLHEFYYRMRVSWVVSFENVISAPTIADKSSYDLVGPSSYSKNFSYSSSKAELDNDTEMADTENVDIKKIMTS